MTIQFTELLDRFNIPYKNHGEHHHVTAGWIGIDCPYCSPGQGSFKMGYNLAKRYTTCWSCGPHMLSEVVMRLTGKTAKECWNLIGSLGVNTWEKEVKVQGKLRHPLHMVKLLSAHRKYLESRGFDCEELVRLWDLKAIGAVKEWKWRIVIPIYYRGEIVSYTSRSIDAKAKFRYLTLPPQHERIHHKDLLYGEDYCKDAIIICEGPADVWKIGPGAVCTFGVSYTQAQLLKMSNYLKRFICFDSEVAAQNRASRLAAALSVFPGTTTNIQLETGKDAGAASLDEIAQLRSLLT